HHVSAAGTVTCQALIDTVQLPSINASILGFHQGAIIPSLPQGPSNTPTCIVVWDNRSGTAIAERFDAMGNRAWGAAVTVAQGIIVFTGGWPAAVSTTAGGGLVLLYSIGTTGNWELRAVGVTETGALMGPVNGSVVASNAVPLGIYPWFFEAVAISGGACVFWQEVVNSAPIEISTLRARR